MPTNQLSPVDAGSHLEDPYSASREYLGGAWPRYDAAVLGFRNYWFPVMFSRDLDSRPRPLLLLGEQIVLVRDSGRAYALHDRCPHRGVPLSIGRREAPGCLTCAYHGWTFDLASGDLVAALTDSPDSPICGKASVRVGTYPVEERAGLVWVYVGELPPPPVEDDIPEELLAPGIVVVGTVRSLPGNWRYAAENGMDEGHARYLHRTALWTVLREMPAWTRHHVQPSDDGKWILRIRDDMVWDDVYPRVGRWPRKQFWQSKSRGSAQIAGRLPCIVRNLQTDGGVNFEFYVPADAQNYHRVLLMSRPKSGIAAWRFRAWYSLWARWIYHGLFNDQDQQMIQLMRTPPERLYRPDASITAWRRWCHDHVRRATEAQPPGPAPIEQSVREMVEVGG